MRTLPVNDDDRLEAAHPLVIWFRAFMLVILGHTWTWCRWYAVVLVGPNIVAVKLEVQRGTIRPCAELRCQARDQKFRSVTAKMRGGPDSTLADVPAVLSLNVALDLRRFPRCPPSIMPAKRPLRYVKWHDAECGTNIGNR